MDKPQYIDISLLGREAGLAVLIGRRNFSGEDC
jgi:hypothetical protein